MLIYTMAVSAMKDQKQLLDDSLARLESIVKDFRQTLKSDIPIVGIIDGFKLQLESLMTFVSSLEQDQELEQRRQVLHHLARFICKKVDRHQNPLEISKSAAYFLCKEEDPRLRIEATPSQQTRRVMLAAQECLIGVKVHYEKLNDYGSCLRQTEIFFVKANDEKPTLTRVEEEISWDSLTSDIRDVFLKQSKRKVSFQIYPS